MRWASFVVAAFFAVLSGLDSAQAAILTKISDTSTTKYFYSDDDQLLNATTTFAAYSVTVDVVFSNWPGDSIEGGSMEQSLTIRKVLPSAQDLYAVSRIVNNDAVLDLVAGTQAISLAQANALVEKAFTTPSGPAFEVTSSASGTRSQLGPYAGVSRVSTTVNNVTVTTNNHLLANGSPDETKTNPYVPAIGGQYYLSQELRISGAGLTSNPLTVTGSSAVLPSTAGGPSVPEPATFAIWGAGMTIAGLVGLRRKK